MIQPLVVGIAQLCLLGVYLSCAVHANTIKVYRYQDAQGNVAFSDRPPLTRDYKELFYDCYACGRKNSIDFFTVALVTDKYHDEITAARDRSGLSVGLIRAMIHAESGFNPQATSRRGAIGLTQLMPATAKELGVDPFNTADNILGGSLYMASLLKRYNGDLQKAAAAYNAGAAVVDQYQGPPPFAETTAYLKRLTALYQRYEKMGEVPTE